VTAVKSSSFCKVNQAKQQTLQQKR